MVARKVVKKIHRINILSSYFKKLPCNTNVELPYLYDVRDSFFFTTNSKMLMQSIDLQFHFNLVLLLLFFLSVMY